MDATFEPSHSSGSLRAYEVKMQAENVKTGMLNNALSNSIGRGNTFPTVFHAELDRIAKLLEAHQNELEVTSKELLVQANGAASGRFPRGVVAGAQQQQFLQNLKQSTNNLSSQGIALQSFLTTNRKSLMEIAKDADTKLRTSCHANLMNHPGLSKESLRSGLICIFSDLYEAIRKGEHAMQSHNASTEDALWQAPSSFQRSTTKYWVKDENLTNLMLTCAAEAPLLVYGKKGQLSNAGNMHPCEGDKLWDELATKINSVYFDSDDMSLYKDRIQRLEGAQLLRARWYGDKKPVGKETIFLELKTHHEKWVAQKSVKERATIQEGDMVEFLRPKPWTDSDAERMVRRAKPKLQGKELQKATNLLLRMHNLVVQRKLSPCVRSVYARAAFQSAKSNDLRLTLDREVTLIDERLIRSEYRSWCLLEDELGDARTAVVPYNVFEVKLAKDGELPPGLANAEKTSIMELAEKFSKFTTGAAAFNYVPILPYWAAYPAFYSFFGMGNRPTNSVTSSTPDGEQGPQSGAYNIMGSYMDSTKSSNPQVRIAPKNPARIEPKTYFANERTFIQWISASLLMLSVSSLLLKTGTYNMTAAVISLSSLVLVSYSSHLYFRRLEGLKVREPTGYFDSYGPILLSVVVGATIFLILADAIKGSDFLSFLEPGKEKNRRFLRQPAAALAVDQLSASCGQSLTRRAIDHIYRPSGLLTGSDGEDFLVTSDQDIFQVSTAENGHSRNSSMLHVPQAVLHGLAMTDDNRIFTVSKGPVRTELIELSSEDKGGHRLLKVRERWTLVDEAIDPSGWVISHNALVIQLKTATVRYSIPQNDDDSHPVRLGTINSKILHNMSLTTSLGGIAYMLHSGGQSLEAWDLSSGTLLGEIPLPSLLSSDSSIIRWRGFSLQKRQEYSPWYATEEPERSKLVFHVWSDNEIWSMEVQRTPDFEMSGVFTFSECLTLTQSSAET